MDYGAVCEAWNMKHEFVELWNRGMHEIMKSWNLWNYEIMKSKNMKHG